jgi:exodeoxyribonuclease VII small subunit
MPTKKPDYKSLTAELQAIVEWFESDKVNLDEAVGKYEQALEIIKQTEDYLKTTENKITKINQKFNP